MKRYWTTSSYFTYYSKTQNDCNWDDLCIYLRNQQQPYTTNNNNNIKGDQTSDMDFDDALIVDWLMQYKTCGANSMSRSWKT